MDFAHQSSGFIGRCYCRPEMYRIVVLFSTILTCAVLVRDLYFSHPFLCKSLATMESQNKMWRENENRKSKLQNTKIIKFR